MRIHRSMPIACLLVFVVSHAAFAQNGRLKILLTNDDGYDAAGLTVMRTALVAAGHEVTVVAPATNMSSTGMSMTSGTIKIERKADAVWAVHGTPADAAMIGLAHILKNTPPDLVVSGTNAGQNLGASANTSGTVSAALAAARFGVPAIATSAGLGDGVANAYRIAADLTSQIVAALVAKRPAGGRLLPDRMVINLNVPSRPIAGIKWTPLSARSSYARVYSDTANPNEVQSRLTPLTSAAPETDTDFAMFLHGYVTLTLLDGDLSAGATSANANIVSTLSTIALPQPAAVP